MKMAGLDYVLKPDYNQHNVGDSSAIVYSLYIRYHGHISLLVQG
jgi:hypothetical protein